MNYVAKSRAQELNALKVEIHEPQNRFPFSADLKLNEIRIRFENSHNNNNFKMKTCHQNDSLDWPQFMMNCAEII